MDWTEVTGAAPGVGFGVLARDWLAGETMHENSAIWSVDLQAFPQLSQFI
jgi:hypothetical protein